MKLDFRYYTQRSVILLTFVVFLASLVLARLGLWQISRYYERQQFNHQYLAQSAAPEITLENSSQVEISKLEYRHAVVTGQPLDQYAIVRINQYHDSVLGYSLLTPLQLVDGSLLYIDRGWIPKSGNEKVEAWSKYALKNKVTIKGVLRIAKNSALDVVVAQEKGGCWLEQIEFQV